MNCRSHRAQSFGTSAHPGLFSLSFTLSNDIMAVGINDRIVSVLWFAELIHIQRLQLIRASKCLTAQSPCDIYKELNINNYKFI